MTTIATSMPDYSHAMAFQHIRDLHTEAARRHGIPTRPVLARTRRTAKAVLRWLWAGQLALVPTNLVDPAPHRSSY